MDAQTRHPHTNRLIQETSPYLLQHAHNPVDWYAWGDEALARARAEDKPILLSIGYSACHWCHVMEHESFEDEDVARAMNEHFICIKVDREERPDLDKIYQLAHQMLAQRPGGWPLNMFLTPDDHTPFFGGTYFPKDAKYQMPAFTEVLQRVAAYYREHRGELEKQNASVRAAFARIQPEAAAEDTALDPRVFTAARSELEEHFDPRYGGFGQAPKFPHPTNLERCLRQWAARRARGAEDKKALEMARFTLQAMASGGIYDQLGGGFCRYSVDEKWMIPHFEKMLYDNGPLLALYADAAIATDDATFQRIALETGAWVMREMQAPEGGYYSTLDADSEGHEGKFYVWTRDEVRALLDDDEYQAIELRYGFDEPANFEHKWWHLHIYKGIETVADRLACSQENVDRLLAQAHAKLYAAREQRVRPGRDEKILTSWNGLMILGMARAGRLLGRPAFVASAERALHYIRAHLWKDGRLLATSKDGRAHLNAYLDDYVFLIDAILEMLQARWRSDELAFATALADAVLARFQDAGHGAFFFTSDDHERLVYRPKPLADEATPAGNGIAARVLLRLGHLLGRSDYLDAAERTLKALYPSVARYASAHNAVLNALEDYLAPVETLVIRGQANALIAWQAQVAMTYAPTRQAFSIPADADALPEALAQRAARPGTVLAYICTGHQCGPPVTTLEKLIVALAVTA